MPIAELTVSVIIRGQSRPMRAASLVTIATIFVGHADAYASSGLRPAVRSCAASVEPRSTPSWGFDQFIARAEVLDEAKGWLKDGALVLEAHLRLDPPPRNVLMF